MAIKDGLRPATTQGPNLDLASDGASGETKKPPAPCFGRTARVVADWGLVDASETPHEKNKRGELGKPLFNWYFNRTGPDALSRIAFPQSSADKRNTLQNAVARTAKGAVNPQSPEAVASADPKTLSVHIQRVSEHFGANVIGIAAVHPSMLYSGDRYPEDGTGSDGRPRGEGTPEAMAEKYPYAICLSTACDYNMIQAHRHHIGDHAYHFSQARLALVYANVAAYIREMGYEAIQNRVQPMPNRPGGGGWRVGPQRYTHHGKIRRPDTSRRPHPDQHALGGRLTHRHRHRRLLQGLPQVRHDLPHQQHHYGRKGGA